MELSLTGIKISIDLGRAESVVADDISSTDSILQPSSPGFA